MLMFVIVAADGRLDKDEGALAKKAVRSFGYDPAKIEPLFSDATVLIGEVGLQPRSRQVRAPVRAEGRTAEGTCPQAADSLPSSTSAVRE